MKRHIALLRRQKATQVSDYQLYSNKLPIVRVCQEEVQFRRTDVNFDSSNNQIVNQTIIDQHTSTFAVTNVTGVYPIDETSGGAFVVTRDIDRSVVNEIQISEAPDHLEVGNIELVPIGAIEHEDAHEIVGLRIWKEQRFGMVIYSSGIIDVFEFDPEERYW